MLATHLSLQGRGDASFGGGAPSYGEDDYSDDGDSDEALRATWVGAVVAGMNQARPIPSGGKCCCLGTGLEHTCSHGCTSEVHLVFFICAGWPGWLWPWSLEPFRRCPWLPGWK